MGGDKEGENADGVASADDEHYSSDVQKPSAENGENTPAHGDVKEDMDEEHLYSANTPASGSKKHYQDPATSAESKSEPSVTLNRRPRSI